MPPSKGTKVKIDKARTLRFRARAWEAFERETGRNILSGGLDDLTFGDTITLIWCGLLHEDPDLPKDIVLDAVGFNELAEMQGALEEALRRDVPSADEEPGPGPSKKKS